ncbi:MAG TPA: hypothetical protein VMU54_18160, partial [Planctomycetota bacterium]|nr:hypothetical protein [Planctomycetota bacterium]
MNPLLILLVLASGMKAQGDSARQPVPDAAAQKEQEALIKSVFKAEYAKTTSPDRKALATKLLQQAAQTQDNVAARFVLYRESRDLAAEGADISTSFAAIDAMAGEFKIAPIPMKVAALATMTKAVHLVDDFRHLALWYLKLAEEAIAEDDLETALMAAGRAASLGRSAKDVPLTTRGEFKTKEAGELKNKFDAVRKARETLSANPDDGPANAAVGEYLCLVRGDWAAGLPHLSKGEGRFRDLARMDLSDPQKADEQAAVGDGWWEASERERGRSQENVRRRAIYWYELASPRLSGLLQAKVHQRMLSLAPAWSTNGLFAYWKMDEGDGSVIADSSGNRRNGKLAGASWTKGVSGTALHFDGGNQKVILDAGEVPLPWTVTMWVRREASPNPSARITDATSYEKGSSLRLEQSTRSFRVGITRYRVIDYAFPYTAPL